MQQEERSEYFRNNTLYLSNTHYLNLLSLSTIIILSIGFLNVHQHQSLDLIAMIRSFFSFVEIIIPDLFLMVLLYCACV